MFRSAGAYPLALCTYTYKKTPDNSFSRATRSHAVVNRVLPLTFTIELYREMSDIVGNRPRPFVIAHSLGTYLVGRALRHFQDWSCHTIILTGCVLSRTFPWFELEGRFHYASNEVARMDLVPLAASLLGLTVKDMGCAGILGFKGSVQTVHNVLPTDPHPNCRGKRCSCKTHKTFPACRSTVHNVCHKFLRHSDYFEGKNHAWRSWLPTLWGYDPVLYRGFVEACQLCHTLETGDALSSEQDDAADALRTTCWGWTYGPLERFVKKELKEELRILRGSVSSSEFEMLTDIVISSLWYSVSSALAESDLPEQQRRRSEILEHLNPRTALKRCIEATLKHT